MASSTCAACWASPRPTRSLPRNGPVDQEELLGPAPAGPLPGAEAGQRVSGAEDGAWRTAISEPEGRPRVGAIGYWRLRPCLSDVDSLFSPHSLLAPSWRTGSCVVTRAARGEIDCFVENLERAKGFEPSTPTLARCPTRLRHPIQLHAAARFNAIDQYVNRHQSRRTYPGGSRRLASKCLELASIEGMVGRF